MIQNAQSRPAIWITEVLLSFNKSVKCTLDNRKYTGYNIWHSKDWSALLYQKTDLNLSKPKLLAYILKSFGISKKNHHVLTISKGNQIQVKQFLVNNLIKCSEVPILRNGLINAHISPPNKQKNPFQVSFFPPTNFKKYLNSTQNRNLRGHSKN